MDKQTIRLQLKDMNLNVDIHTINQVENFLFQKVGFISDIDVQYQIFGGTAIVSEIQTLPTIGKVKQTSNGIRIQNVMSHLGNLSKEKFLDTLNRQLQKTKQPPQKLKKRIEDIRFSYRFYKKYQNTFEVIYDTFVSIKQNKQFFSALFWVIYLYVKNSEIETENIGQAKILLILMFRAIFENFIAGVSFDDIFATLQMHIGSIPQISEDKYQFYISKIQVKIDHFYSLRFFQGRTNFDKLIKNNTFLERLMDDISNAYVKEEKQLKFYNQIDQLFLILNQKRI